MNLILFGKLLSAEFDIQSEMFSKDKRQENKGGRISKKRLKIDFKKSYYKKLLKIGSL